MGDKGYTKTVLADTSHADNHSHIRGIKLKEGPNHTFFLFYRSGYSYWPIFKFSEGIQCFNDTLASLFYLPGNLLAYQDSLYFTSWSSTEYYSHSHIDNFGEYYIKNKSNGFSFKTYHESRLFELYPKAITIMNGYFYLATKVYQPYRWWYGLSCIFKIDAQGSIVKSIYLNCENITDLIPTPDSGLIVYGYNHGRQYLAKLNGNLTGRLPYTLSYVQPSFAFLTFDTNNYVHIFPLDEYSYITGKSVECLAINGSDTQSLGVTHQNYFVDSTTAIDSSFKGYLIRYVMDGLTSFFSPPENPVYLFAHPGGNAFAWNLYWTHYLTSNKYCSHYTLYMKRNTGPWEEITVIPEKVDRFTVENLTNGNYSFRLKLALFKDNIRYTAYSNTVHIIYNSTEDIQRDVKIYPNPAVDILNIHQNYKSGLASIIDLNGKTRAQYKLPSGKFSLPVNDLESGVYFLQLYFQKEAFIFKFIRK